VVAPVPDAQVVIPDAGPPADATPPADALPPVVTEDDAGEWMPPDPVCTDGIWRLAPGFLLARRVDYVADRDTPIVDGGVVSEKTFLISEAGMPCASAMNRERCLAALKLPGGLGRHLVTSAGDTVQLWGREVVLKVLGMLDTPAEALWWLTMQGGYLLPCDVRVETSKDGFRILGALSSICGETPNATHRPLEVLVQATGTLSDFGPINLNDPICASEP
jgi:hypothetical protein